MTKFVIFNVFHYTLRNVNNLQVSFGAGVTVSERWREGGMKTWRRYNFCK